jgi:hypothetical protein
LGRPARAIRDGGDVKMPIPLFSAGAGHRENWLALISIKVDRVGIVFAGTSSGTKESA